MKRKFLFPIMIFGVFSVVLFSCDKVEKAVSEAETVVTEIQENIIQTENVISFKILSGSAAYVLEESAEDFGRDVDVVLTDSISMVVPTDVYGRDIEGLKEAILSTAFETVAATPEQTLKQNLGCMASQSGYELVRIESSAINPESMRGMSETHIDVFSLTPKFLVYRINISNQMPGAAHGQYNHKYVTYSIAEGKVLRLKDIFSAVGLQNLPQIISKQAKEMKKKLGKTDISELPSGGNFYVSLDGAIVFVYQPYEVASFAQGVICVPVYPDELSEQFSKLGQRLFLND